MSDKKQPTRRERARREAVEGAITGAVGGFLLGNWLGDSVALGILWAGILAFLCAVLYHHNECMCG